MALVQEKKPIYVNLVLSPFELKPGVLYRIPHGKNGWWTARLSDEYDTESIKLVMLDMRKLENQKLVLKLPDIPAASFDWERSHD